MERTAKVFKSGNSQALRLPKEFNTDEKQFYIRRIGSPVLLSPKACSWEMVIRSLTSFSDDYFEDGRNQPPIQQREMF